MNYDIKKLVENNNILDYEPTNTNTHIDIGGETTGENTSSSRTTAEGEE